MIQRFSFPTQIYCALADPAVRHRACCKMLHIFHVQAEVQLRCSVFKISSSWTTASHKEAAGVECAGDAHGCTGAAALAEAEARQ